METTYSRPRYWTAPPGVAIAPTQSLAALRRFRHDPSRPLAAGQAARALCWASGSSWQLLIQCALCRLLLRPLTFCSLACARGNAQAASRHPIYRNPQKPKVRAAREGPTRASPWPPRRPFQAYIHPPAPAAPKKGSGRLACRLPAAWSLTATRASRCLRRKNRNRYERFCHRFALRW